MRVEGEGPYLVYCDTARHGGPGYFLPETGWSPANPEEGGTTLAQRAYEVMVILNPNVAEDDLQAAAQRISDQIAARGGRVEKVDTWGRRRLYYPIRHVHDGHYVVYTFRAEPPVIRELEASWRIADDVLRHLVISKGE